MRIVKKNYNGPVNDELTHVLSRFLKTVPAEDRRSVDDPNGYVMDHAKLIDVTRQHPEFQHLVDVGSLWYE